jgi:hypothetical protein
MKIWLGWLTVFWATDFLFLAMIYHNIMQTQELVRYNRSVVLDMYEKTANANSLCVRQSLSKLKTDVDGMHKKLDEVINDGTTN